MIKWFQNWIRGKQAASAHLKEAALLDVAHEVLKPSFTERDLKRQKVKAKVKKYLFFPLVEDASCEMADEITETITEACEADPKIDRLFDQS